MLLIFSGSNQMNHRVFISTHPYGAFECSPIDILCTNGFEVIQNPCERKLNEIEVADLFREYKADYLIAGTERLSEYFFRLNRPKAISRVGVGYDAVDLNLCREHEVPVFFTPNAPRQAVVDQAIASICHFGQRIDEHYNAMTNKIWARKLRRGFPDLTIGIIGFGRIGSSLASALHALRCKRIMVSEINPTVVVPDFCESVGLDVVFSQCDVVCLHASREPGFDDFIDYELLSKMRSRSCFINLARGELVDEDALISLLKSRGDLVAYLDVFKEEPYTGPLTQLANCFCTAHLGSMTPSSRVAMETISAENLISFVTKAEVNVDNIVYMP